MSDGVDRPTRRAQLEALEGHRVSLRVLELQENPIPGNFDLAHLQATHAYLFQDIPKHQPGVIREDTGPWAKIRALENKSDHYEVHYMSEGISDRIETVLTTFGGPGALKGLSLDETAAKLAKLYGDLDHAHGFYEGNSRTLRVFTRALAAEAGFELDWTGTNVSVDKRNTLYAARDIEVISRQYPGVTSVTAQKREEYEATSTAELFRKSLGPHPLQDLIRSGLSPLKELSKDVIHETREPTAAPQPEFTLAKIDYEIARLTPQSAWERAPEWRDAVSQLHKTERSLKSDRTELVWDQRAVEEGEKMLENWQKYHPVAAWLHENGIWESKQASNIETNIFEARKALERRTETIIEHEKKKKIYKKPSWI